MSGNIYQVIHASNVACEHLLGFTNHYLKASEGPCLLVAKTCSNVITISQGMSTSPMECAHRLSDTIHGLHA